MRDKVYVEFYVEKNSVMNKTVHSLTSFLSELFCSGADLVHFAENEGRDEPSSLIFSFEKPIMKFNEEAVDFFEKLDKVFRKYQDFSPHFTQFDEDGTNQFNNDIVNEVKGKELK